MYRVYVIFMLLSLGQPARADNDTFDKKSTELPKFTTKLRMVERNLTAGEVAKIAESKKLKVLVIEDVTFEEKADSSALLLDSLEDLVVIKCEDMNSALSGLKPGKLPTLKKLWLQGERFRTVTTFLNHLPALEELNVDIAQYFSNRDLEDRKLPALKKLRLANVDVTDEGLALVVRAAPDLEELDLYRCRINGSGFRYLVALRRLKTLHAVSCPIDERNLKHLSGTKLVELNLHRHEAPSPDPFEEVGFGYLAEIKTLKRLTVVVNDDNREHVAAFKKACAKVSVREEP